MAADITDKARKSYSLLQKTLNGSIDDNDTTLTPNNVTNIPTDTAVTMIIDRVDSSGTATPTLREIVTGTISGGTITNLVRGQHGTTAQSHNSGAVIEFVMAGNMWNDLIDLILGGHTQLGYHKTVKDTNGNEILELSPTASAVNHLLARNAATANTPKLEAAGDDTNINLHIKTKGTGEITFVDGNGNEFALLDYVASAVNYLGLVPSAIGNRLQVQALGDDTNIDIDLVPKGSGILRTNNRPIWWEELGRTTLGSAGDAISIASIPARKYLKIICSLLPTGGTIAGGIRFNNDSGNNYTYRTSLNNGADNAVASTSQAFPHASTAALPLFFELEFVNIATQEKIGIGQCVEQNTAGAAAVANKIEASIKWVNTSNQITRVDVNNAGTGDFAIGSELIVLGHD